MRKRYPNTYDFFICAFFRNQSLISLSDFSVADRKELIETILSEADDQLIEWYFNCSKTLFNFNRIFYMQALGMQKKNVDTVITSMVNNLFNLFTPILQEIFEEAESEYFTMQKEPVDDYSELRAANDQVRRVS